MVQFTAMDTVSLFSVAVASDSIRPYTYPRCANSVSGGIVIMSDHFTVPLFLIKRAWNNSFSEADTPANYACGP